MKPSSLVGHVVELLDLVVSMKRPADKLSSEFFRKRRYLGAKDRRFIADTLFDILRHYRKAWFYAEQARQQLGFPSLPPITIYSAYAVKVRNSSLAEVLSGVKTHWKFSLPNIACEEFLRTVETSRALSEVVHDQVSRLSLEYSFPEFIINEWLARFGEEETTALCTALNQQAPTVVRVNTLRATREACRSRLADEGVESEPTLLSPYGLLLKKRINIPALQSFREGWFELQDEGSQLLSLLLEPQPGQVIVDACAGGGGKTLHIAALMRNEGTIHAFDVNAMRLESIRPRLMRSGAAIVKLHQAQRDGEEIAALAGAADAVLVDAPCSGIGTFRRNPGAKMRISESYIERLTRTQRSLVEKYAALIRPGGRLVYSTCTLLYQENEEVVEGFLHDHTEFESLTVSEILQRQRIPLNSVSDVLLLLPHRTGTDGFFGAVMQRRR